MDMFLMTGQDQQAKDFATADLIRDTLNEAKIQLEDRADGTDWTIK